MLGHSLISRKAEPDDHLGQMLSITMDADSLILHGVLLRPYRIKDYLFTQGSIENMKWENPVQLFDSEGPDKQMIGAGKVEREKDTLFFTMKLLSQSHKEQVLSTIKSMGLTAFERIFPMMPIFKIKKEDRICTICDRVIGSPECGHKFGMEYLRHPCRAKILKASLAGVVWSGIRPFSA